jgi:hypothetical protein
MREYDMAPQLFLDAIRMAWFLTHPTRERAICAAFDNQYAVWDDNGEIEYQSIRKPKDCEFTQAVLKLQGGYVPDWREISKAEARETADENVAKHKHAIRSRDRDWSHTYWSTRANHLYDQVFSPWPKLWHMVYSSRRSCAINAVPDNVTDEWLALAVEYAEAMATKPKTDFTSWTIWEIGTIKHRVKMARKYGGWDKGVEGYLATLRRREEFAREQGWPSREEHRARLAADREWVEFYSPEARARRANEEHAEVRAHGAKLLAELRGRFARRLVA